MDDFQINWHTGNPPKEGDYIATINAWNYNISCKQKIVWTQYFDGYKWCIPDWPSHAPEQANEILAWAYIPNPYPSNTQQTGKEGC